MSVNLIFKIAAVLFSIELKRKSSACKIHIIGNKTFLYRSSSIGCNLLVRIVNAVAIIVVTHVAIPTINSSENIIIISSKGDYSTNG